MITKEDTEGGKKQYETGFRIQIFSGIKELTGSTPKEFMQKQYLHFKQSADIVIHSREEKNIGLFHRFCLETIVGPYHILYSFFWNNKMDLAAITIAGAPKEEWETYRTTFDQMGKFEIIDMSRFEEQDESAETPQE